MTKKVFSVKDGSIKVKNGYLVLFENDKSIAATCNTPLTSIHLLPSTLIRNQTDKELAEESAKGRDITWQPYCEGFLAGRKSVGGDFHLTREELDNMINELLLYSDKIHDAVNNENTNLDGSALLDLVIDSLTPPIYPHTIEVMHDGEKYYWSECLLL